MKQIASVLLVSAFLATPAWAGEGSAAAIAAFDAAESLLAQGKTAQACDQFAKSYALDPQLGSLLHLADCRERNGEFATAWSAFRDAADLATRRGDEREKLARDRAEALAPRLSHLTIHLTGPLPSGAVVSRNGRALSEALLDTPLPVDGGEFVIQVTAPGYQTFETSVQVAPEKDQKELTLPLMVPESGAASGSAPLSGSASTAAPQGAISPDPSAPKGTASPSVFTTKWPALVALGVGIAGGVVGGYYFVNSWQTKLEADKYSNSDGNCRTGESYDHCVELRYGAIDLGNVATGGAIVAGVGVAAAVVLWFAIPAPSAAASATTQARVPDWSLGVRPGGLTVRGSF